MSELPKLRDRKKRTNITVSVDNTTEELYRLAKRNGYDAAEIARRAITEEFIKLSGQLRVPTR